MGDRALRTRGHATRDPSNPGQKVGGTAWERALRADFDPASDKGRCYQFGGTFQKQCVVFSPCAAGKMSVTVDQTRKMRRDLAEVKFLARPRR